MKSLRFISLRMGIVFCLLTPAATATFSQMSPVPFIDILSPTSTYPGHGDFTLTISGANFATGATVQFDGLTLTPSSLSRNSLTVTVPAAAVASAHTASVTVKDPNSNSSNLIKSNVAFFPITTVKAFLNWTNAFSVLDPPSPFGLNFGPPASAIAVGDFNGDGHQDVVVAHPANADITGTLPGTIQIYFADGKGNFTGASPISTPGMRNIVAMEVGDFNNDGFLDVAATDSLVVTIFFNDGAGNLTAGASTALPTWDPTRCAILMPRLGVADIDGDGVLDLVFPISTGPEVAVLLGDGLGHFTQSSKIALPPVNDAPFAGCGVSVGDFNGDGWVDIAYGTSLGQAVFAFNDGTGGFGSANTYSAGFPASAAGDMTGDGFLDLVGAGYHAVNVFTNQQNGTFAVTGPFTPPATVQFIADIVLGDLTGGGALGGFIAGGVGDALIGNGSGSLSFNAPLLGASLGAVAVRLGDFNEDGRLDVVYAGFTDPNVGPNGVAFEYWLQVPGPPIWSVPQQDFGTVILHLGQMSGNQQQLLTEVLSNSGPGPLDIVNITSKQPGPAGTPTQTDFPISTAASTCPLNGGTLQPGGSCTVVLSFQPRTFGTFSETLSVLDDANGVPGSAQNVTLTGTAIELDASIQQPINADGTSVFSAKRGVVPVKFTLQQNGVPVGKDPGPIGCQLPPATIGIIRTAGGTIGPIDESVFEMSADSGANFRIDTTSCQYVYNLDARALGAGSYSVQILVGPVPNGIGSATFGLR